MKDDDNVESEKRTSGVRVAGYNDRPMSDHTKIQVKMKFLKLLADFDVDDISGKLIDSILKDLGVD